jgi:hypothetical protein
MPETTQTILRIAVAQSTVREDPTDADGLRASAAEIRRLMKDAADAGARLVHFTEGAICFPSKFVMSELGPDQRRGGRRPEVRADPGGRRSLPDRRNLSLVRDPGDTPHDRCLTMRGSVGKDEGLARPAPHLR